MKIHILSDLHTEFEPFDPPLTDSDVVIIAGDAGVGLGGINWIDEHFEQKPVIYVAGNHEYYGKTLQKQLKQLEERAEGTRIHMLENGVAEIDGYVFLGCTLWTDFELFGDSEIAGYDVMRQMSDFSVIRVAPNYRKLNYRDTIRYHRASLSWLESKFEEYKDKKLIVVTHHAPSAQSITRQYQESIISAAFASNCEDIVSRSGALLWVHGHVHSVHDYYIGQTRVLCNPKGYPGEEVEEFNGSLVVEL